jgi:hypothetical protein
MSKSPNLKHKKSRVDLPGIAYIIAFLIGVLLFLLFGESLFGIKPQPVWIAGLMGLAVSAIVFWVWSAIHKKKKDHDTHD